MKKFSFKLDKVLDFKQQIENSLRGEHARAMKAVTDQERLINELEQESAKAARKLDAERRKGCTVMDIKVYDQFIDNIQKRLVRERQILGMFVEEEEKKRQEVIEAKTETSSISKLKEKKVIEYDKIARKEEERLVEEFVVNTMAFEGR